MKILLFLNVDGAEVIPLTPEICEQHAIGGTGTAAARLAAALRRAGHEVEIVTSNEEAKGKSADVLIACRDWRAVLLDSVSAKLRYLWCQDDVGEDMVRHLQDAKRAEKVYSHCQGVGILSHYQMVRWLQHMHLPIEKIFFTSNGVDISPDIPLPSTKRPKRAYYASYPNRGLELLLKAWPLIHGAVPDAELWVFSSSKIYHQSESSEFLQMYERAEQLPGVKLWGSVGQKQLREAACQCRTLAYPCVYPETSCITAMEAMAAGCVVVGTLLGALPETAWRNPCIPQVRDDWLNLWAAEVCRVFVDDDYYLDLARQNQTVARFYSYDLLASRWLQRIRFDAAALGGSVI